MFKTLLLVKFLNLCLLRDLLDWFDPLSQTLLPTVCSCPLDVKSPSTGLPLVRKVSSSESSSLVSFDCFACSFTAFEKQEYNTRKIDKHRTSSKETTEFHEPQQYEKLEMRVSKTRANDVASEQHCEKKRRAFEKQPETARKKLENLAMRRF